MTSKLIKRTYGIAPFLSLAIVVFCTGLLASCGGGGGGSGATTVNGIAVPAQPDATQNNATLAGVDSNSNGVRDDAEIMIASMSKKDTYESYSLQLAQLEQRFATESIASQADFNSLRNQEICLDGKRTREEREIMSLQDIKSAIVNNRARSAQYTANETKYSSGWLGAGSATCN